MGFLDKLCNISKKILNNIINTNENECVIGLLMI